MNRAPRPIPVLLALLTLALAGCTRYAENPFQGGRQENRAIEILVDNNNFLDATVYAESDGNPVRLGEVTGKTQAEFQLSPKNMSMAAGLRFRVELVGSSQRYLSPGLYVAGGERILLSVAGVLRQSFVAIR